MKNLLIYLKNNLKYYIWAVSGLCLISWYFYITFIRERLPRDIPFMLTEFRFYALLGICCVYIFAIKRYIFPKPLNPIFIPLIQTIAKPLVYFDNFIKTNKYVLPYYVRFFRYITFILDNNFFATVSVLSSSLEFNNTLQLFRSSPEAEKLFPEISLK